MTDLAVPVADARPATTEVAVVRPVVGIPAMAGVLTAVVVSIPLWIGIVLAIRALA